MNPNVFGPRNRAFTIVELLVAISIVTMLSIL